MPIDVRRPYMSRTAAPPAGNRRAANPEYLTVAQAADYLNVTPRWIKRAYLDGRLASLKLHEKGPVRIPRADLDRFIEANTREAR
jgi:excisionase family DNA binding protein